MLYGRFTAKQMQYAIREHTPVSTLPKELSEVHLVRPISAKKMLAILQQCPSLNMVGASSSVEKRLAPKTREVLQKHRIHVKRNHKPGRALNVDLEKIKLIADLRKDFLSMREIEAKTGVPKSTIHYLLKKAKRQKIHKGKNVIYV